MPYAKVIRVDMFKPDTRNLSIIADYLNQGKIIIYPTDTVYTMGCRIDHIEGFKRLCQLKQVDMKKAKFSIVCRDFSHLSDFSAQLDNATFRLLKKYLPGPFTFILPTNRHFHKIMPNAPKTIGIRVPDVPLVQEIILKTESPIFSASILIEDEDQYDSKADIIIEKFYEKVDLIIDGGNLGEIPSTIVDLTSEIPEIIRQGKGIL
ncbi:MAG: L-threonylcarbamoyladenylate synthase [Chitinophagales bacterium]|jgi:tRNA threonylcarbamoyl adenosine modification protein (Sua5/YciO/YrdC/YwlC family)|nr:L-threonylcarbamoyladenylate synthase [Chitinophagales bacterium]